MRTFFLQTEKKRNGTFHFTFYYMYTKQMAFSELTGKQTNKQNKTKTRPCALPTELILCQMEKTKFIMGNSDTVGHYKCQGPRFKLDGQFIYFFQLTFMFCGRTVKNH